MDATFITITPEVREEFTGRVQHFVAGLTPKIALRDWTPAAIAKTDINTIIDVSVVRKVIVPAINNQTFFECRCLSSADEELTMRLLFETASSLQPLGKSEGTIGVMTVLEKEIRTIAMRSAAWPEYRFFLMGFTKSDRPIYIHYFNHARI